MSKYYVKAGEHDYSRFVGLKELRKQFTRFMFSPNAKPPKGSGGIVVSTERDEYGKVCEGLVDGGENNTAIISDPGSGKTRRALAGTLLSIVLTGESAVIHDPKGELFSNFYSVMKQHKYKIYTINTRNPKTGDRFNVLENAANAEGDKGRAMEMASGVANAIYATVDSREDPFWAASAVNLFLCYFEIACQLYEPDEVCLSTIYRIHVEGNARFGGSTYIREYLEMHSEEKFYELGNPSVSAPRDTKMSIDSVFSNALVKLLINEDIEDMLSGTSFDVKDMIEGNQPVAIFIISRDEESKTYSTVVSTMINEIYSSLIDIANEKYKNQRFPKRVHFILDEFGNLARLDNIQDMMTASRSRGIKFFIVLQSMYQLHQNYSDQEVRVIIGNSQNLLYLSSSDMELVKMISERCGERLDPNTNETRRLLTPDRLTHLNKEKGEILMLLGRNYPYISYLPDMSCYELIEPTEVTMKPRTRKTIRKGVFTETLKQEKKKRLLEIMNMRNEGKEDEETEEGEDTLVSEDFDFHLRDNPDNKED